MGAGTPNLSLLRFKHRLSVKEIVVAFLLSILLDNLGFLFEKSKERLVTASHAIVSKSVIFFSHFASDNVNNWLITKQGFADLCPIFAVRP